MAFEVESRSRVGLAAKEKGYLESILSSVELDVDYYLRAGDFQENWAIGRTKVKWGIKSLRNKREPARYISRSYQDQQLVLTTATLRS